MSHSVAHKKRPWWQEKSVWIMLFLGFSAGIPIFLIFSSLSLWLREAGVSRSSVTFFSWAVLGYSFKFVWAPLIDRLPLPLLTRWLGRRRAWLLVSQFAVIGAIIGMALTNPAENITAMAIAAVALGFASATQDVVIDAFRIESAEPRLQAMLSSTYIAGYRTGMIVAGAGALFLAESLGSSADYYSYSAWQTTYLIMASTMLVGVVTTFIICEPQVERDEDEFSTEDHLSFLGVFVLSVITLISILSYFPKTPLLFDGGTQNLFKFVFQALGLGLALFGAFAVAKQCLKHGVVNAEMVHQGYIAPILDFFKRYGKLAIWVLLLVGFYRISDIVLGIISNVFYADMGYSKAEIASMSKVFGVIMTITGSFLGGFLVLRIGVMRALQLAAVLVVLTNLLFLWLTSVGQNHTDVAINLWIFDELSFPLELALVITGDNLVQGLSLAAFIAWLSSLTNVSFTATQYAIFSSLMTMFPKVIGGFSGTMVDAFGYHQFFLFASALGIPVIVLIHFLQNKLEVKEAQTA